MMIWKNKNQNERRRRRRRNVRDVRTQRRTAQHHTYKSRGGGGRIFHKLRFCPFFFAFVRRGPWFFF